MNAKEAREISKEKLNQFLKESEDIIDSIYNEVKAEIKDNAMNRFVFCCTYRIEELDERISDKNFAQIAAILENICQKLKDEKYKAVYRLSFNTYSLDIFW